MADSPWLTDRQQQVWRSYLAMSAALDRRIERGTQDSAGMPHAYYLALAMLSEAPDRTLRMSQLAEYAQMSQSRLSHAVARLEESGWVVRSDAPDDKRGHLATLTDAGWDRLVSAAPQHAETVRSIMFDGLTDEQLEQFGVICDLVLGRAEKSS